MSNPHDAPSPPPSPSTSAAGSSTVSSHTSDNPTYTPDEIAAIFLNFYTFLTTLHYDENHLKVPPPGGWPGLTPPSLFNKSAHAIEVMRRLPYFSNDSKAFIHYKSRLVDYSSYTREDFEDTLQHPPEDSEMWSCRGDVIDLMYIFPVATGRESYGRQLFLNTKDGEIIEDMIRADILDPMDIQDYFGELSEAFRSLKLIPCQGRCLIDAVDIKESSEEITEGQILAQKEEWATDLDVQYIRQLYRQHGWPDAFCRDEATKAIDGLMNLISEQRCEWVWPASGDWDQIKWT